MRRPQRLIAAALLVAFSGVLGGCSSGFGAGFDPTDMLDWLDTKKKLPGERKPVFPEGVPGMEQGVPKELYKNNVERQQREMEQQNAAIAAVPPQGQPQSQQPLEPPPGSKAALKKLKGKPQQAAAPAADQQVVAPADGEAAAADAGPAADAAPPAPKPKKIVRKRITAPPPDAPAQSAQQAPASGAFPAPLPGGTFTR